MKHPERQLKTVFGKIENNYIIFSGRKVLLANKVEDTSFTYILLLILRGKYYVVDIF